MDRGLVYPGSIPLETDILTGQKNAYVGLGKLAAALLGTSMVANGLTVGPTGPASMNVQVAAGELYMTSAIDASAYSSLAADTGSILKQGILPASVQLALTAPGTVGYSVNYLIQATFSEQDTGLVALPYYNPSNPAQAWSGANNSGVPQATARQDICTVSYKAGTAAPTGSQTTPAPDANSVGLAVVTVAYGQATITSGNISRYVQSPLIPAGGLLGAFVGHTLEYADDVGAVNAYAINLAIPPAAYVDGMSLSFSTVNASTSATPTMNVNGLGAVVITAPGGGTLGPGQIQANTVREVRYNSTGPRFELQDGMATMVPGFPYADATGTPDALLAAYTIPNFAGLVDGYDLTVGIASLNATTTPSFAPTINGALQTARTIVKFIANAQVPVAPGDLQGDAWLKYDSIGLKWILQNPGLPSAVDQFPNFTATANANALTGTLTAPFKLNFRNATLATGTPVGASILSNLTLTVPSGATLGTTNGVAARLVWLAAYNGGTPVLCVVNLAGGLQLDETNLISPTTISAGATAANVIYSASAVGANSPYRVLGITDITEATAGTWATNPTNVQPAGGQGMTSIMGLGSGQAYQSQARTPGTAYYNTTGKPIWLSFSCSSTSSSTVSITINGTVVAQNYGSGTPGVFAIVPPGASYVVNATNYSSTTTYEMR